MIKHLFYKTNKELQDIRATMKAQGLTEVSIIGLFVGKHLLFTDGKADILPRNIEAELDALAERITALEPPIIEPVIEPVIEPGVTETKVELTP